MFYADLYTWHKDILCGGRYASNPTNREPQTLKAMYSDMKLITIYLLIFLTKKVDTKSM